jgi:hypothetical protein
MYDKIKYYYDNEYWDVTRVKNAVDKEAITEEEYQEITGFTYPHVA